MLVKPQTYMNNSGEAIREIYKYFDFEHDKLIVIYDDILKGYRVLNLDLNSVPFFFLY